MQPRKEWQRFLPVSRLRYPPFWSERFKYFLWRVIAPFHPFFHKLFLFFGFFRYAEWKAGGRQKYLIGTLAHNETPEDVAEYLVSCGYKSYDIASRDEGEVVSLRLLSDFNYQYHIRLFADGEVRGHYEYTTEAHPLLHHRGTVFEPRREEFLRLLKGKITPCQ